MFMYVGTAAGVAASQVVTGKAKTVQDVIVSEVQDTLTNVFNQIVHLPPPVPSGPYTGRSQYTVVGAGSPEWNGEYTLVESGGSPILRQTSNSSHALYAFQGAWRLGIEGEGLFYVASMSTGSNGPPLTGWTIPVEKPGLVGPGSAPAPHLLPGN